MKDFRLSQQSH